MVPRARRINGLRRRAAAAPPRVSGGRTSVEIDEGEGVLVVRAGRVRLSMRLPEGGTVEGGKPNFTLGLRMNERQVKPLRRREGERVDRCPANDHGLGRFRPPAEIGRQRKRSVPIAGDVDARLHKGRITRQHDRLASGQRPADRLEGLAAHDQRLAPGEGAEALQVAPEAPDQLVVAPDHAVVGDRRDDDERGGQALSASCASASPVSRCTVQSAMGRAPRDR